MPGPFVHNIDPIIGSVGGIHLWWYGLSYTFGFLELHWWLTRSRKRIGLNLSHVYDLTLFFTIGVLLGGRFVEVIFYEWAYYSQHPLHIPAYWLGGMATHGLMLGAILGTFAFCRTHGRSFLEIADALVIPGAFLLGVGRLGNFIDGQIVGAVTGGWWGVKFPDADGFRHAVVLYDGMKNLLLIPLLLVVRERQKSRGIVMAHFIFWYGFLRIFIDLFREYRVEFFILPPGQDFNIFMSLLGIFLFVWLPRRKVRDQLAPISAGVKPAAIWIKRFVFALVLFFSLTMPSDWTQDIPARYGKRHDGLKHSAFYPVITDAEPDG
ncbi:MAG: prolipoprotein diacylglyceryl transferase [Verrucomicrobia bacterium]|nr:prolipoprotein diacylglyceryl transferase [Verrucomicrobiota bacterium]